MRPDQRAQLFRHDGLGLVLAMPGRASANLVLTGPEGRRWALSDLGRGTGPGLRAAGNMPRQAELERLADDARPVFASEPPRGPE